MARQKVEKEKRHLLSAASNHPPSQSSSTAAKTATDQGDLVDNMKVELNKVGNIFDFNYDNYLSI